MTPFDPTQIVSKARAQLILDTKPSAAFLATLAMQLNLVASDQVETMQTDATSLWFNPTWASALPKPQLQAVLATKVLQCGLLHPYRRGNRDPATYVTASNQVVYQQLKDWGYELPPGCDCEPAHRNLSVEQVYAKLTQGKPQGNPQPQGGTKSPSGKPDAPGGSQSAKTGPNGKNQPQTTDPKGDSAKNAQNGSQGPSGAPGSPGKGNPRAGAPDSAAGSPATGNGAPGNGPRGAILPGCPTGDFTDPDSTTQKADADGEPGPPPMTAEDWSIVAEQAALAARAAGFMPGALDGLLKSSRQATNNWAEELKQYTVQSIASEQSYSRPNRRFLGSGMILPGMVKDVVGEIVMLCDTSGSTQGPILKAIADVMANIIGEVQPEKVTVLYVDTSVRRVDVFDRGDDFELHNVGGGGTLFQPAFDWIEKEGINPLVAIYLTDLYCGDQPVAPSYPVIWAVPNFIDKQPPFEGPVVHVDVV